jgi:hypothetical protein
MQDFIKDDMLFRPYPTGGYQCIIPTRKGLLSVRYGGHGLFTTPDKPYEIMLPTGEVRGSQTADDIFDYVKKAGTIERRNK